LYSNSCLFYRKSKNDPGVPALIKTLYGCSGQDLPQHVIWISTKQNLLTKAMEEFDSYSDSFYGFCYTGKSKVTPKFDPVLADIQIQYFMGALFNMLKELLDAHDSELNKLKSELYCQRRPEGLFFQGAYSVLFRQILERSCEEGIPLWITDEEYKRGIRKTCCCSPKCVIV
jgi:hypothetical protein